MSITSTMQSFPLALWSPSTISRASFAIAGVVRFFSKNKITYFNLPPVLHLSSLFCHLWGPKWGSIANPYWNVSTRFMARWGVFFKERKDLLWFHKDWKKPKTFWVNFISKVKKHSADILIVSCFLYLTDSGLILYYRS